MNNSKKLKIVYQYDDDGDKHEELNLRDRSTINKQPVTIDSLEEVDDSTEIKMVNLLEDCYGYLLANDETQEGDILHKKIKTLLKWSGHWKTNKR